MPYDKRRYWQSLIRIGHSQYGKFDCIELQIYQCTQFLDGILKVFIVILLNQHINWFGHCSGENDQVTLGSSHVVKSFTDSVDIQFDIMHPVVIERKKEYSHMRVSVFVSLA
jgi:hypothetical protein